MRYLVAQSKHETANFTSPVMKRENNLFGMKHATRRKQLGTIGKEAPDGGNYQHYTGFIQSVRDQLLYLDAVNFPQQVGSAEHFVDELFSRGYFGTTGYSIYLGGLKNFLA